MPHRKGARGWGILMEQHSLDKMRLQAKIYSEPCSRNVG